MPRRIRAALVSLAIAGTIVGIAGRGVADAPPGRYMVGADGTVTDTMTKLVWQKTPETPRAWAAAQNYCATTALPGIGWRLPSPNELMTLVDPSKLSATELKMDTTAFADTPKTAPKYWSSASVAGLDSAWAVDFQFGVTVDAPKGAASSVRARCVRSLP